MASKPKKADLAAKCEELGIEVPEKATIADMERLVEAHQPSESEFPKKMKVSCPGFSGINVRKAPSKVAPVVKVLEAGAEVNVVSAKGEWAKVDNGYCLLSLLDE